MQGGSGELKVWATTPSKGFGFIDREGEEAKTESKEEIGHFIVNILVWAGRQNNNLKT